MSVMPTYLGIFIEEIPGGVHTITTVPLLTLPLSSWQ
jgi:hypothetical protein